MMALLLGAGDLGCPVQSSVLHPTTIRPPTQLDPKTDGAARDWVAIYDECSRILYEEIDYTKEGASADLFRANFAGVDWVKVGACVCFFLAR